LFERFLDNALNMRSMCYEILADNLTNAARSKGRLISLVKRNSHPPCDREVRQR
jgi:hypothetical protein